MRCVFLVPHLGAPLPAYFPFWARSCEANAGAFHWYVYSDHVAEPVRHNPAVTLLPLSVDEMRRGFARVLGLSIVPRDLRKVCEYRVLFYFLRRDRERLDGYDFVGYTDLDVLYGGIERFLPVEPERFAVIAADPSYPCGPFTMMHRTSLDRLPASPRVREAMEDPAHHAFDESAELLEVLSAGRPVLCEAAPLQPARAEGFNAAAAVAEWQPGRVVVRDDRGGCAEGAFYHFKRYKRLPTFRVDPGAVSADAWRLDRLGIRAAAAPVGPVPGSSSPEAWLSSNSASGIGR